MPHIAQLHEASVKSMQANPNAPGLEVDATGLLLDRLYMAVEADQYVHTLYKRGHVAEPGDAITQREDPVLATLGPVHTGGGLFFTEDGEIKHFVPKAADTENSRIPVRVWGWEGQAVDQGDEASEWIGRKLGRPARLVRVSAKEPRYVEDDPELGLVGFADGYPVTIASPESRQLLAGQLEKQGQARPLDSIRTTMVLGGLALPDISGLPANSFPEDFIKRVTIEDDNGLVILDRLKACGRCVLTSVNQQTGERAKGSPVLKALKALGRYGVHADQGRYGSDPEFFYTQNFGLKFFGKHPQGRSFMIRRDADVNVEYTDQANWVAIG